MAGGGTTIIVSCVDKTWTKKKQTNRTQFNVLAEFFTETFSLYIFRSIFDPRDRRSEIKRRVMVAGGEPPPPDSDVTI